MSFLECGDLSPLSFRIGVADEAIQVHETCEIQSDDKSSWDAPIFCTRGYESMGWVTGNVSSSRLCCCELRYAQLAAAQPAANSEGVW